MGFLFGEGTGLTQDAATQQRKLALAMLEKQQTANTIPQGLSNLANTLFGNAELNRESSLQQGWDAYGMGQSDAPPSEPGFLSSLLGPIVGGAFKGKDTPASLSPSFDGTSASQDKMRSDAGITGTNSNLGDMSKFAQAIQGIESKGSGGYNALGPQTKSGDRAYGAYQVMGNNIPSWTKEVLGQEMTPEQFLSSPQAQDAVFNAKFGQSVQKYGNPQDAASVWFTGRPLSEGANAADVLGTTGTGYVDKFNSFLNQAPDATAAIQQQAPIGGAEVASLDPAIGMGQAPTNAAIMGAPPLPMGASVTSPAQKLAQAQLQAPQAQTAPQSSMMDMNRLMAVAASPYASPGVRQLAASLLQSQQERLFKQQDPEYQLGLQKTQLEIDNLKNPPGKWEVVTGKDGSIFRVNPVNGQRETIYGPQTTPTGDIQEYEYAKKQGFQGSFAEYQQQMKKAGAQSINIDQKAESQFDKTLAEKQAASFDAMATDGMNAKADSAVIGELNNLLKGQGGMLTGVSGVLARLGIGGEGMGDLQAADSLIEKLIPSQRTPGSGSMSDGDVKMFRASLPSLWKTPRGNQIIINTMQGLAQYKQAQGDIAQRVMTGEIDRKEAVKMLRELPNPLEGFRKSDAAQPAQSVAPTDAAPAQSPTAIQPGTVQEGYRFKGGDPADQNSWEKVQ